MTEQVAAAGGKKQKKKGIKMDLKDFLTDKETGSWADEMDDLPSAPAASSGDMDRNVGFGGDRSRSFANRSGPGGYGGHGGHDRDSEPRFASRAPVELPTRAPFIAHLGNLPFDITESDVEAFFMQSQIISVRIMKDFEDKPKGFAYVEFENLDSLKKALDNSGGSLNGRNVRVSVAEPPREREVREDRSAGEWRREAPIAPVGQSRGTGGRYGDRPERSEREFGSNRFGGADRVPDRSDGGSWRREGPAPVTETSRTWEKPREREPREATWSGGAFSNRAPPPAPAPVERRKLALKPRSEAAPAAATESASNNKSSPFGAAKPIDNDEAIRRVEERRKQENQEKKEAADKARKEAREAREAAEAKEPKEAPAPKEKDAKASKKEAMEGEWTSVRK